MILTKGRGEGVRGAGGGGGGGVRSPIRTTNDNRPLRKNNNIQHYCVLFSLRTQLFSFHFGFLTVLLLRLFV